MFGCFVFVIIIIFCIRVIALSISILNTRYTLTVRSWLMRMFILELRLCYWKKMFMERHPKKIAALLIGCQVDDW